MGEFLKTLTHIKNMMQTQYADADDEIDVVYMLNAEGESQIRRGLWGLVL